MVRHAGSISRREPLPIASRDNRWLKRFRAALSGERTDDGFVGVEGARLVEAALGAGLPVQAVLASDSGARHLERVSSLIVDDISLLTCSDRLFAGVADTRTPQGIAALVRPREWKIEQLVANTALVIALVGIQDPGNVGTIIRAAEAFGATGIVTCPADGIGTADPFSPKAVRASSGSVLRLPVLHGISSTILLAQMAVFGVAPYAAVAPESGETVSGAGASSALLAPWEIQWREPAAILIGNEGSGLPASVRNAAGARVYIPQAPGSVPVGIESLNAAMAATVLLYEAMRQRTGTVAGGQ